jgi:hypothetical protein
MHNPPIASFLNLFSQRAASAIRRLPAGSWRSVSKFHYVSDEEILAAISESCVSLRALTLDQKTSFLAIEIAAASRYNDPNVLQDLLSALRSISLEPRIYRASGGASVHIYLMLTERVILSDAVKALNQLFSAILPDFSTADIEIIGPEGLLLIPLQTGFTWLTDKLLVKTSRDELTFDSAITLFVSDLQKAASSPDALFAFASGQAHEAAPARLSHGCEEESLPDDYVPSEQAPEPFYVHEQTPASPLVLDKTEIASFPKGQTEIVELDMNVATETHHVELEISKLHFKDDRLSVLDLQGLFENTEPTNDSLRSTKGVEKLDGETGISKLEPCVIPNNQPAELRNSETQQHLEDLYVDIPEGDSITDDFPTKISYREKVGSDAPIEYLETHQGTQLLLFPIIPANSARPAALGDHKPSHKSRGRPPNEGNAAV